MKFFFKVLVLVGLIVVGKWEKEHSLVTAKQTDDTSYQAYSKTTPDNFALKQQEQKIKTVTFHLN